MKLSTCDEHGQPPVTFACRHLTRGVACGYHASAEDPANRRPDAWCDLCEEVFQAEGGEWNDVSEQVADVNHMCAHCYDAARTRNAQPPRLARGIRAQLSTIEAAVLFHRAAGEMQRANDASQNRWGWNAMATSNFDDEARTLTFSDPRRPSIVADVRLVGSHSTTSSTFQWAWATCDDRAPVTQEIARLRVFGDVRGLPKLTTTHWKCDEAEGWAMASLAGYVLGTAAIYCASFGHERWFMLLSNLRHTSSATPVPDRISLN